MSGALPPAPPAADSNWRHDFLSFCLDCEVLRFGEFTLKSGRSSPYFFNAGLFNTGLRLAKLGSYYARAIAESPELKWDVLLGPAYKGIPLAAATSMCLATEHGIDAKYCFNRKEAKDHSVGDLYITRCSVSNRIVQCQSQQGVKSSHVEIISHCFTQVLSGFSNIIPN